MPYHLQKHSDSTYSVTNIENGRVHSYHTTLEKAKAQMRLLYAVDHGYTGVGKKKARDK